MTIMVEVILITVLIVIVMYISIWKKPKFTQGKKYRGIMISLLFSMLFFNIAIVHFTIFKLIAYLIVIISPLIFAFFPSKKRNLI